MVTLCVLWGSFDNVEVLEMKKNLEPNQLNVVYHVEVVVGNGFFLGKYLQTIVVNVEALLVKLQLLVAFSYL